MPLPSHVDEQLSSHLASIQAFFKNSKVTLVLRAVGFPDGERDLVMGDDDLDLAIAAIRIRQASIKGAA